MGKEVSSPEMRKFEILARNYMLLAIVSTIFAVVHLALEMKIWFFVGIAMMVFAIFCAVNFAREVDDLEKIARILENEREKEIKALYGKDEEL